MNGQKWSSNCILVRFLFPLHQTTSEQTKNDQQHQPKSRQASKVQHLKSRHFSTFNVKVLPREFYDHIWKQEVCTNDLITRVAIIATSAGAFRRDPSALEVSLSLGHLRHRFRSFAIWLKRTGKRKLANAFLKKTFSKQSFVQTKITRS